MRVALFGGTGFVGSYIIDALHSADHDIRLLVRAGSEAKIRHADACTIISGELSEQSAVEATVEDCDAVIYSVGILRENRAKGITFEALQYEGVLNVVRAAKQAGVKRFLLMSANGVYAGGTPYQDTKFRAEQHVSKSGMDYTIFRPSVIFGDPRGRTEFATQLVNDMIRTPFPAIDFRTTWSPASASVEMSPVHVQDIADAFVAALGGSQSLGQTYRLGGPEALTWNTIIKRLASVVERKKFLLPMPVPLMKIAAAALDWLPAFPVTRDQLTMLAEGNVAPTTKLKELIARDAATFDAENLEYLKH